MPGMKKQNFSWLVVPAIALTIAASAHASSAGLQTDPVGDRSGPVGYAIFDVFADANPGAPLSFTNLAPASAGGAGSLTATISASMTGGSVTGGGDRIYNGVGGSSAAFGLTIDGDVFGDINAASVQIKYTLGDAAVMDLTTYKNFFTVKLNGVTATPTEVLSPVADNGLGPVNGSYFGVVKWSWNDLALKSGDDIAVSITSAADGHVSLDSLSIDATPVPEPGEYALGMALLLAGIVIMRRRRQAGAR